MVTAWFSWLAAILQFFMKLFARRMQAACKHGYIKHTPKALVSYEWGECHTQHKANSSHTSLRKTRWQLWKASFAAGARVIQQLSCKLQQMYASLCPYPLCVVSSLAYRIISLKKHVLGLC